MTSEEVTQSILKVLHSLRFGSLEIVVHDSKVVRIERHERIRLEVSDPAENSQPDRNAEGQPHPTGLTAPSEGRVLGKQ